MFTIDDIIQTLNCIEVKGKENMDRLLGAILALEAIKAAQETPQTEDGEIADG